jgi:glycosyltransferase involved in cell wall biosynthesis
MPQMNEKPKCSPRISVLIPTRNYAHFLPHAIDSVLEQDWPDFEVLIADNASTDGTAEVIARYSARDQRIRAYRHPEDLGMVQNFNWCISQARGKYLKFLFGDDRLASPRALGRLAGLLDDNPTAVLAASARQIIDQDSQAVAVWDDFQTPGLHPGRRVIARCMLANANLIGEPSVAMFRRNDALEGFDPAYRQVVDLEMWFRLLEKGDFIYLPEVLSCFRRHPLQQSEVNRPGQIGVIEFARLVRNFYRKGEMSEWDRRKLLFQQASGLRRECLKDPEGLKLRRELKNLLGRHWYAVCWSRNRVLRPFQNLQHSVRKRWPGPLRPAGT